MLVVGTLDTKGAELRFIRDIIAGSGLRTRLVDVSTSGKASDLRRLRPGDRAQSWPRRIERVRRRPRRLGDGDGGGLCQLAATARAMSPASSPPAARAAPRWSRPACAPCPIGVPKLIISSVASGDVGPYVGPADITMMYSVTDVQGLNSISRQVLANGANALVGMVKARLDERDAPGSATRAPACPRSASPCSASRRLRCSRSRPTLRDGFRMPGVPRHRRRRPLDGEAGRFRPDRRRSSTSPPPKSAIS